MKNYGRELEMPTTAAQRALKDVGNRISRKKPTRIQVVLEYIKSGISDGTFKPGARIPTENEIAEHLGVSRTPVREAVKTLEATGILDVRVGAGTFIHPAMQPSLAEVLMLQSHLRQTTPRKLMETRRIIERGCAELAAERRTEQDLAVMRKGIVALAECAGRDDALDDALEADRDFHRAIYKATGNELIGAIANFVLDMVSPWIRQSLEIAGAKRAASMHRMEYTFIEARNVGGARESFTMPHVDAGMDHWLNSLQDANRDPSDEA